MRPLAILATVLTCATATAAGAQTLTTQIPSTFDGASFEPTGETSALALLNGAAFAPKTATDTVDPISRLIEREAYAPGAGLVRWMTGEVQLSPATGDGPVDSLRVSVGGALRAPGGLPLNLAHGQYDADAYEVAITRHWPAALSFDTKRFGVALTPHAGVGMSNLGGSAEAGATLRLNAMGVHDGGATFGDRGRWYLFAAASGRAVGLNMLHGEGGWGGAGWSTDQTSRLIGDTQVGVGWRRGALQTSLGYIHREVKGQNMLWGVDTRADSMVAFSLTIKPH